MLNAVISLSALGIVFAVILYFVAQKFKVVEDPRIDTVNEALPGANCGGCGFAGCRNFAESLVKAGNMEGFFCPVGGNATMTVVGGILGLQSVAKEPQVAVIRCNGSHANAPSKYRFDGPATCFFAHNLFSGESGCPYGCLGLGDCVAACKFDAMFIDEQTGLPVVVEENCTACGACVTACPRDIIELRNQGPKGKRIFVSCVNREKGAIARKNCSVACIGCGKCVKACPHDAITLENNLAYIDFLKCKLCRKCAPECPTNAILEINFPLKKVQPAGTEPKPEAVEI
ncbi:MAG: RnfABCDGE type electron transport complex subunit B [Lentimicrobiaceae bacterium]|nr:RnfABCDGE type electron transport complex subunit B [Lentimicrobiaceae bacterium]